MAQASNGTVTVQVEPDLNGFADAIAREIPGRPASELRLEALQLAVRTHGQGDQDRDATIVETAQAFADFIIGDA
ncbi:hypothetical protein PBI_OKIROE_1 [Mycobacterium phage OkiRoe]|uniref:hypothetical protein n=1 Tax=Mycobacterium phage OkiRoe TaxID=1486473 RepID=UPI00045F73D4|nr:hypothetical protein PBI_OKIROE_1 [Mycobacterium phage OkiRoe]AHZ95563.1 hypothetical protein PBI_OKIROE_1 [Mycobacterium phage OkiRoe]